MQIVCLGDEGRKMGKREKAAEKGQFTTQDNYCEQLGLLPLGNSGSIESELSYPRGEGAGLLCTTSPGHWLRAALGGINILTLLTFSSLQYLQGIILTLHRGQHSFVTRENPQVENANAIAGETGAGKWNNGVCYEPSSAPRPPPSSHQKKKNRKFSGEVGL